RFVQTWDRALGGWISFVAALLVLAWLMWLRRAPIGKTSSERTSRNTGNVQRVLIATSNAGKLRDFAGAASALGIEIAGIPNFSSLSQVVEDGLTFEDNARKKA